MSLTKGWVYRNSRVTMAAPLISQLKFYHIQLTLCSSIITRVCFDGTQKMFVRWKLKRWKAKFSWKDNKKVDRDVITNDVRNNITRFYTETQRKFYICNKGRKLEDSSNIIFVSTRNVCNKVKLYILWRYHGLISVLQNVRYPSFISQLGGETW